MYQLLPPPMSTCTLFDILFANLNILVSFFSQKSQRKSLKQKGGLAKYALSQTKSTRNPSIKALSLKKIVCKNFTQKRDS
jgi:hypothetical protein